VSGGPPGGGTCPAQEKRKKARTTRWEYNRTRFNNIGTFLCGSGLYGMKPIYRIEGRRETSQNGGSLESGSMTLGDDDGG
jgi:hypothetical protein